MVWSDRSEADVKKETVMKENGVERDGLWQVVLKVWGSTGRVVQGGSLHGTEVEVSAAQ